MELELTVSLTDDRGLEVVVVIEVVGASVLVDVCTELLVLVMERVDVAVVVVVLVDDGVESIMYPPPARTTTITRITTSTARLIPLSWGTKDAFASGRAVR